MTFNALPNGVCNSLCGGDRYFRFEDKQNMETSKQKDMLPPTRELHVRNGYFNL